MERTKERKKLSYQNMFYSAQRIDLLIISICGAGIYVCLETIKYLTDNNQEVSMLIKISGGLFVMGIIINFISQWSGYRANEQDYLMCDATIIAGNKINDDEQKKIDKYDKNSEHYSKWTNRLNISSMGIMFLALILIMVYFFTF